MSGLLANNLKWLSPGQTVGVINVFDVAEAAEEDEGVALAILRRAIEECAQH